MRIGHLTPRNVVKSSNAARSETQVRAVRRESHADRDLGFIPDTENPRMGFLRSLLRFGVEVFERPVAFT